MCIVLCLSWAKKPVSDKAEVSLSYAPALEVHPNLQQNLRTPPFLGKAQISDLLGSPEGDTTSPPSPTFQVLNTSTAEYLLHMKNDELLSLTCHTLTAIITIAALDPKPYTLARKPETLNPKP